MFLLLSTGHIQADTEIGEGRLGILVLRQDIDDAVEHVLWSGRLAEVLIWQH